MNIAFHSNQLSLRGTEVAIYDYARYNEEYLGNDSMVLARHPDVWEHSHPSAIENFKKRFPVFFYHDFKEVEKILDDNQVDVFYAIKAGMNDGVVSKNRKSVNHIVFQYNEPHGDVYAYVSEWLGNRYRSPFVPHMVTLPDINEDLRTELNIPKDAIVFGRHGGADTFDVPFAHEAVIEIAKRRDDIYFLFLYTNRFTEPSQKNVIYLDGNQDLVHKTKFINTCDAMLHARRVGETFGLAVAEFSIRNKPVITKTSGNRENAHIQMLGNKGIYYNDQRELLIILDTFTPNPTKDWNAYRDYNPETVMDKFKAVFLT